MDEKFAARTHFQRRVVHGMLIANYVSTLVGMRCPGPARFGASRTFAGRRPVFIGDKFNTHSESHAQVRRCAELDD